VEAARISADIGSSGRERVVEGCREILRMADGDRGETPEERDLADLESHPWGKQWPPPPGAGNFAGAEATAELPVEDYRDDFANTSPVGSFAANTLGLHDMAGNVWQWCRDPFQRGASERTLRGSSWFNGAIRFSLLSSCRIKANPDAVSATFGFRVVVAPVKPAAEAAR
jgi:Sulfatase-modifying factor enzyme 1